MGDPRSQDVRSYPGVASRRERSCNKMVSHPVEVARVGGGKEGAPLKAIGRERSAKVSQRYGAANASNRARQPPERCSRVSATNLAPPPTPNTRVSR